MPIRIYAFAKELGFDNKKLLDICEKAGIKGKGSALASLTDDEIAKVNEHLDKSKNEAVASVASQATTTAVNEPVAPLRETVVPSRSGQVRDLNQKKVVKREGAEVKKEVGKKKPAVTFKAAAMPEVQQPEAVVSEPTEKVQKPDISLPQDAIRKAKSGEAPLKQFTQSKAKPKKTGGKPVDVPEKAVLGQMPSAKKKDKRDRKSRTDDVASEMGSVRQQRPARRRPATQRNDRRYSNRREGRRRGQITNTAAPRKEKVALELPCSVRSFSEAAGLGAGQIIKALMELGAAATINAQIDDETAQILAEQFDVEINFKQQESLEDQLIARVEVADNPDAMVARPPIVTFLGHVDHGKTSLLDAIIGIDVVSGEAGGITQHIRAYEIEKDGQKIAFVDTPGHEAFTEMRARGANVTDIAVLVVAADDGVMPQTEEAISHAKAAGVPIIVALNKIDLPGANPEKAFQDLAAQELLPSEWGGDIEVVKTSAIAGTGLDELLETILVTAELHEYQADPTRNAIGTCIESEQQSGRGVIAKVMVQNGTLRVGDVVVCGSAHGRVKAMYDTLRPKITLDEAGPSTPVNITGLDIAPGAGDKMYAMDDITEARQIAESREDRSKVESLAGVTTKISLEEVQRRLESGSLVDEREVVELNLIIRADVRGSIEAMMKEMGKLEHPEIKINVLQSLVGGITVADVRLAQASQAVIVGFNVIPDDAARSLADELQVEIRRYDVIYKITDDIRATLEGRLKPDENVVEVGSAMILRTFSISKTGTIAGCRVMRGTIHRDCRIRVIRDSRVIGDYAIDSLRREKDDVKEVQRGMECGIRLANFNDVKDGDTLEAYKIEEVARTL